MKYVKYVVVIACICVICIVAFSAYRKADKFELSGQISKIEVYNDSVSKEVEDIEEFVNKLDVETWKGEGNLELKSSPDFYVKIIPDDITMLIISTDDNKFYAKIETSKVNYYTISEELYEYMKKYLE